MRKTDGFVARRASPLGFAVRQGLQRHSVRSISRECATNTLAAPVHRARGLCVRSRVRSRVRCAGLCRQCAWFPSGGMPRGREGDANAKPEIAIACILQGTTSPNRQFTHCLLLLSVRGLCKPIPLPRTDILEPWAHCSSAWSCACSLPSRLTQFMRKVRANSTDSMHLECVRVQTERVAWATTLCLGVYEIAFLMPANQHRPSQ